MQASDRLWMLRTLELAKIAEEQGEVPVGALVIGPDQQLLAEAYNQNIQLQDPTAHAEILAIRSAAKVLGNYRLKDCSLYVSLEPCSMCAAAMLHARMQRLVFACRDFRAGAAGSVLNLVQHPALNHAIHIDEGLYAAESMELLKQFFNSRR